MRVIAGEHGGRRLLAPPGQATRPTPERVRGALFSALEVRLGGPGSLAGTRVLDLYAGSGALGIEALSRGARHAVFVERDLGALAALRGNLAALGLADRARVLPGEAERALALLGRGGERFDAVLLDPPHASGEGPRVLARLAALGLLSEAGVAVLEHAAREPAGECGALARERTRRYGTVAITFYSHGAGAAAPDTPRTEDAP